MRIKKVSQTTPVQAQIVDGYSESTTDGYSCNYVNEEIKRNVITCKLASNGNYNLNTIIPLNDVTIIGDKLTYSNSKIKVGAGVNKVLVSAQMYINYSATNNKVYGFAILQGSDENISVRCQKTVEDPISVSSGTVLLNVQENDEFSMKLIASTGLSNIPINANNTFITIEVVE